MTTDDGASLSQARVHDEVRRELLEADARAMAATLARDLIAPLVRLNLGDVPLPTIRLLIEDPDDLTALADNVTKLHAAGLPIPQWWVREKFGIPEPTDGEAVLGAPGNAPDAPPQAHRQTMGWGCAICEGGHGHGLHATKHAQQSVEPTPDEIMADRLEIESEDGWRAMMGEIERIVNEAESLPALRDALLSALGHLPDEQLVEAMANGFAAAELAGRFMAREESDGR